MHNHAQTRMITQYLATLVATTNEPQRIYGSSHPAGNFALATLPPWHYSSDCTAIEYWANPDAIQALLPPGLAADPKSTTHGCGKCLIQRNWNTGVLAYYQSLRSSASADEMVSVSGPATTGRSTPAIRCRKGAGQNR